MLVQITPRDTRARDPENTIQNKPMVPWTPPTTCAPLNHERLKTGPFLVAHQTTNQDSLPQSYLESEITRVENPLCQHVLVVCGGKIRCAIPLHKLRLLANRAAFQQGEGAMPLTPKFATREFGPLP